MDKVIFTLSLLSIVSLPFTRMYGQTDNNTDPQEDFEKIYPMALQGDLNAVFSLLDTLTISGLSDQQLKIRDKFYNRFIRETESFQYNTTDSMIITFVDRFHTYWKSVLLDKLPLATADSLLEQSIAYFLFQSCYKAKDVSLSSIKDDLYTYSNDFLQEAGYHSNAFGKTAHLYDLFLWKEEEIEVYAVPLIDDTVHVEVHFMKDFISNGWAHYATLGRSYAGGWATSTSLFAVDEAYDRTTEQFEVSYLSHEGQHFADYLSFPNLKQTDLEYRAKLIELIKSKTTTHQLIRQFIANGADNINNAHAFANYYLINALSELIFKKNSVTNPEEWASIDPSLIRDKSLQLYKRHTEKLMEIGKDTVTRLIDLEELNENIKE